MSVNVSQRLPSGVTAGRIVLWNPVTGDEAGYENFQLTPSVLADKGYSYSTLWSGAPPIGFLPQSSGMTFLGGIVRKWELRAGSIKHALAIKLPTTAQFHTWPAVGEDTSTRTLVPMGARLRLPMSFNVAAIVDPAARALAQALQEYGAVVVGTSTQPEIVIENDATASWGGLITDTTATSIPLSALQVLDWRSVTEIVTGTNDSTPAFVSLPAGYMQSWRTAIQTRAVNIWHMPADSTMQGTTNRAYELQGGGQGSCPEQLRTMLAELGGYTSAGVGMYLPHRPDFTYSPAVSAATTPAQGWSLVQASDPLAYGMYSGVVSGSQMGGARHSAGDPNHVMTLALGTKYGPINFVTIAFLDKPGQGVFSYDAGGGWTNVTLPGSRPTVNTVRFITVPVSTPATFKIRSANAAGSPADTVILGCEPLAKTPGAGDFIVHNAAKAGSRFVDFLQAQGGSPFSLVWARGADVVIIGPETNDPPPPVNSTAFQTLAIRAMKGFRSRTFTGCRTSADGRTVTLAAADSGNVTRNMDAVSDKLKPVTAPGAAAGTYVASVVSTSQFTLSSPATANLTNATITVTAPCEPEILMVGQYYQVPQRFYPATGTLTYSTASKTLPSIGVVPNGTFDPILDVNIQLQGPLLVNGPRFVDANAAGSTATLDVFPTLPSGTTATEQLTSSLRSQAAADGLRYQGLTAAATMGVGYVDFATAPGFWSTGILNKLRGILYDALHPTEEGMHYMARAVATAMLRGNTILLQPSTALAASDSLALVVTMTDTSPGVRVADVRGMGLAWHRLVRNDDTQGRLAQEVWVARAGAYRDAQPVVVTLSRSDKPAMAQLMRIPGSTGVESVAVGSTGAVDSTVAALNLSAQSPGAAVIAAIAGTAAVLAPNRNTSMVGSGSAGAGSAQVRSALVERRNYQLPAGVVQSIGGDTVTASDWAAVGIAVNRHRTRPARRQMMGTATGAPYTLGNWTTDMAAAAQCGKWVRFDCDWSLIETARGTFSWAALDGYVNAAVAAGLEIILTVAYTPTWARVAPATDNKYEPTSVADYAAFCAAAVNRYKDRVQYWEVWNEPNSPTFWKPAPNPTKYAAMLKAAFTSIKAADPSAYVITGGTSPSPTNYNFPNGGSSLYGYTYNGAQVVRLAPADWYAELLIRLGCDNYFDGIGHHPYWVPAYGPNWRSDGTGVPARGATNNRNDDAFGHVTQDIIAIAQYFVSAVQHRIIWATEVGEPCATQTWNTTFTYRDHARRYVEAHNAWLDPTKPGAEFYGPFLWYRMRDVGDTYGHFTTAGVEKATVNGISSFNEAKAMVNETDERQLVQSVTVSTVDRFFSLSDGGVVTEPTSALGKQLPPPAVVRDLAQYVSIAGKYAATHYMVGGSITPNPRYNTTVDPVSNRDLINSDIYAMQILSPQGGLINSFGGEILLGIGQRMTKQGVPDDTVTYAFLGGQQLGAGKNVNCVLNYWGLDNTGFKIANNQPAFAGPTGTAGANTVQRTDFLVHLINATAPYVHIGYVDGNGQNQDWGTFGGVGATAAFPYGTSTDPKKYGWYAHGVRLQSCGPHDCKVLIKNLRGVTSDSTYDSAGVGRTETFHFQMLGVRTLGQSRSFADVDIVEGNFAADRVHETGSGAVFQSMPDGTCKWGLLIHAQYARHGCGCFSGGDGVIYGGSVLDDCEVGINIEAGTNGTYRVQIGDPAAGPGQVLVRRCGIAGQTSVAGGLVLNNNAPTTITSGTPPVTVANPGYDVQVRQIDINGLQTFDNNVDWNIVGTSAGMAVPPVYNLWVDSNRAVGAVVNLTAAMAEYLYVTHGLAYAPTSRRVRNRTTGAELALSAGHGAITLVSGRTGPVEG